MSEYTLISSVSKLNYGKYYLIKPAHPYIGFCGYLWQVIRAIHKYPNQQYYVHIGTPNIWKSENIWDFYFKQPHTDTPPNQDEIIMEVGLLFDESSEFVDLYPSMQAMTIEQKLQRRTEFGSITGKYFHLRDELQAEVDAFINTHFKGKKILGFHHRGTDHPHGRTASDSFLHIDEKLEEYDAIFVTTDEIAIINELEKRYGNKLIRYNSTTRSPKCDFQMERSPSDQPTHAFRYNALINWSKKNNGYTVGLDVIMETKLLSSTDFLLCNCNSNVNYFIRAWNSNLPYKIIYTPPLS
jgi:hypothetical protein